jgi:prepilin-type processing-associated H-X9-DG protein/prepilin-type N-terminal cleavage/methylation domain-containing protein
MNRSEPSKPSRSAFSLVELLVVIGIIGVLAALLLPALASAKRRAQQIQCVSNLHQMGLALSEYLGEQHFYPWPSGFGGIAGELGQLGTNHWNIGIWRCPSARWRIRGPFMASYGYNAFGVASVGNLSNALGLVSYTPIPESQVAAPSEMIAAGDGFTGGVYLRRSPVSTLLRYGNTLARHQGKANALFCDGHGESPQLGFMFEDSSDQALVRWNRDHLPHRDRL